MKFLKSVLTLFALVGWMTSCQDVITLDLNNGVSKLVVNGYVSSDSGPYTIKLSQSSNYFDPNVFVPEKGAIVMISDNAGQTEILKEIQPGVYVTSALKGIPNRTYVLSVTTVDKKTYTAISYLPAVVPIDSLHFEVRKRNGGFGQPKGPLRYRVTCTFTDPSGLGNYYRIRYYKNDTLQNAERDYVIASDQLANGQSNTPRIADGIGNTLTIRGAYLLKDSVKVDLLTIDKAGFDFYSDLQFLLNDQSGIFPSDAPANPINNISNGALGYFGAFGVATKKIVIR
jgi:hypothetical protein